MGALDPKFVEPFVKATIAVMESMACVSAQPCDPATGTTAAVHADIVSLMPFNGSVDGFVMISFPQALAVHIVRSMFEEAAESQEGVDDALRELINTISGQAQAMLAQGPYHFDIDLPHISHQADGHELVNANQSASVPFNTSAGQFVLGIGLNAIPASA